MQTGLSNVRVNMKADRNLRDNGFLFELTKNKVLFLMILPAVLFFLAFSYVPMAGAIVSFKEYNIKDGILFSPWNGLYNFKFFLLSGRMWQITSNTLLYNMAFIITQTTLQITVAILLVEMPSRFFRKLTQSMMFLPYFISWVIVSAFFYNIFNFDYGIFNNILELMGQEPIDIYTMPEAWKYVLVFFSNWKWLGYGTVLYMAAVIGIDRQIYESAEIDGANIFQKIRHITIPILVPTMIILVLLQIGRIFRGDFDMFYQLIGDAGNLFKATDVIDTYVFRALLRSQDIGMASAAAFYQSVLCFITISIANFITRKIDKDSALF